MKTTILLYVYNVFWALEGIPTIGSVKTIYLHSAPDDENIYALPSNGFMQHNS